jgi:hypothetical protein
MPIAGSVEFRQVAPGKARQQSICSPLACPSPPCNGGALETAGAAPDVFEQEPLPADHKLWTLPGVLLTPHTAGYGPYLDDRRYEIILDNCRPFPRRPTVVQPRRQGPLVLTAPP